MIPSSFIIFILIGLFAGILSSFFGIGGGVIIIPGLYFLFTQAEPSVVIAVSHALILLTAIVNVYHFRKRGLSAPLSFIIITSLPLVFGIQIGRYIVSLIDTNTIKIFFSFILLLAALKTFFYKIKPTKNEDFSVTKLQNIYLIIFGFLGGIVAGMTGIGGGLILVPLILSCSIPMSIVPFLSNIGMGFATLVATVFNIFSDYHPFISPFGDLPLSSYQLGLLYPIVPIYLFVSAYFGSKIGLKFSEMVNEDKKRLIFTILLIILSIRMYLLSSS